MRRSEEFLQTIYSHSDIGVFVVDVLEKGEYRYVGINPVHEKLVRMKNEEVMGKSPRDLEYHLGKETVDYVIAYYDACVEKGETLESETYAEIEGKGDWWFSRLTPLFDEEGRWRAFSYEELLARDKVNLDIFWLRDESLEDTADLPAPDVLAAQIVEDLWAALAQFGEIAEDLGE